MASEKIETITESGFKFSLEDRTLKIHNDDDTLLWESGKDVIRTGRCVIDYENLMKNGNVKDYPKMDNTLVISSRQYMYFIASVVFSWLINWHIYYICTAIFCYYHRVYIQEKTDSYESEDTSDCSLIHDENEKSVTLKGKVDMGSYGGKTVFRLTFKVLDSKRLSFQLKLNYEIHSRQHHNFIALKHASDKDEEIYGMGIQYTVWNFKGRKMPLIVREKGVGHGLQPHTAIAGIHGGDDTSTYAPATTYITNKERAFFYQTNYIGYANFNTDNTEMIFFHTNQIDGILINAKTELEQCQLISRSIGTMRKLPKWTSQGMIAGIVGGQKKVEETKKLLTDAGVKLAGIWMQDWVGQHKFPEGTRLKWSWKLSRQQYPEWDRMVDEWAKEGIKPITYCSSYIGDLSGIGAEGSDYFKECDEKGYFVKNAEGKTYTLKSLTLKFGIIDFTNPKAREFCKNLIKENVIKEARSGGWMHDFGEYLPFDARIAGGRDALLNHNEYALDWAKVGWEAIQETENGDELFYFMRAGTGMSPAYTTLFWMGDQFPTYDRFNGMQSAMIGLMNSGLCGFTLGCSDIGGYACFPLCMRNQRLVERWIEMNAFSDMVMRSHPSIRPDNYQIWSKPETLKHLAKFVNIHVALADYKQALQKEANEIGTPATRPMMLHFRGDAKARADVSQFMLGENVLVAPVFSGWADRRNVYLPGPATWIHVWSGKEYSVGHYGQEKTNFPAPLGQIPVFYRNTAKCNLNEVFKQFVEK